MKQNKKDIALHNSSDYTNEHSRKATETVVNSEEFTTAEEPH